MHAWICMVLCRYGRLVKILLLAILEMFSSRKIVQEIIVISLDFGISNKSQQVGILYEIISMIKSRWYYLSYVKNICRSLLMILSQVIHINLHFVRVAPNFVSKYPIINTYRQAVWFSFRSRIIVEK